MAKKTTKEKAAKNPVGRPKREFTADQINRMSQLALAGCQNNTIATLMDIPKETLVVNFGQLLTKKRCERKYNLRKLQNTAAKKGNPALLIFLGKNVLGQQDKVEQIHGVTDALSDLMKEISTNGSGLPIKE